MSFWRLIQRDLVFYRRTNVAVGLTVAIGAAVLTGALAIGDSVRYSLSFAAQARLGTISLALVQPNRFFRAALADDMAGCLGVDTAPVLAARGLVGNGDGTKRINKVEILGVDERFFKMSPAGGSFADDWKDAVILSEALARRLDVRAGDEVLVRVDKPGLMPRDIPLVPDTQRTVAARLAVRAIAGDAQLGRFGLQANQTAALNLFLPLGWLQDKLGQPARANMLLVAGGRARQATVEQANHALRKCLQLADAGLSLRETKNPHVFELRSSRVFLEDTVVDAAMKAADGAVGVFTYFVNEIRIGDRATPYSMVAALESAALQGGIIPPDMREDEIVINQWLADDLSAKTGNVLELKYFVLGPMRKLYENQRTFRVRAIVSMEGAALDPQLMPDFPGLADTNNCRDWQPGIPIDLDKIRQKDEDYWDKYHGTPKAFVTLRAGRQMWANRCGSLTAVRYPGIDPPQADWANLAQRILENLEPASVGFFFRPAGQPGGGGGQTADFGQIFAGLSMFLIVAAVILTGLVFVFGVENRSEQIGTLAALGYPLKSVRYLFFCEGAIIAAAGSIAGVLGGLLYTKVMVYCLMTVWSGAVAGAQILFHCEPATLIVGGLGGFVAAIAAIWFTLQGQARRPVSELLSGVTRCVTGGLGRGRAGLMLVVLAGIGALVIVLTVGGRDSSSEAVSGAFFAAGALLLIAALAANHALLGIVTARWSRPMVSLGGLAFRNVGRRAGRSIAVVGLLACGVFLIVAVGANRRNPLAHAEKRDSGTGGFALFAESAMAILNDLNDDTVRRSAGLGDLPKGVEVVHLRVYDGEDASCLNLNRVQRPKLLAVRPQELAQRGAFRFTVWLDEKSRSQGWDSLNCDLGGDVVPAIGDYPTVFWALGRKVGDEIEYTDERGRNFRLRIVGMIESSILQGCLVISEDNFTARFPSEDGYRMLLVDAPQTQIRAVQERFSTALRDFGAEVISAKERLAGFSVVENTYLSIFTMVGGLGLVLGSIGLGLVVMRNALERRAELAMLRAMGFSRGLVKDILFYEHAGLLISGVVCGLAAALVAVVPALRWPGGQAPYPAVLVTIAVIGSSSAAWVWFAAGAAVRGDMMDALRNE